MDATLLATLEHLRDECIRMAPDSLAAREWRVARTSLGKTRVYDDQRDQMEREEQPMGY